MGDIEITKSNGQVLEMDNLFSGTLSGTDGGTYEEVLSMLNNGDLENIELYYLTTTEDIEDGCDNTGDITNHKLSYSNGGDGFIDFSSLSACGSQEINGLTYECVILPVDTYNNWDIKNKFNYEPKSCPQHIITKVRVL